MSLTDDALSIWQAGVDAVRSETLVSNALRVDAETLTAAGTLLPYQRLIVVGAGKAGAGMAAAVEAVVSAAGQSDRLSGWVNVPADCVRPLSRIRLHAARPAGLNEPTEEGVEGSRHILNLVGDAQPGDVCLVLLSGGGSALLPAPVPGISLADKQAVTRFLMRSGATIHELNTVRKQLSEIKGGGLARALPSGARMVTLIISDIVGDPLDVIASGPTVADSSTPAEALAILQKFEALPPDVPTSVFATLERAASQTESSKSDLSASSRDLSQVENHVIGNNATALEAASRKARELGYVVHSLGSGMQGEATAIGRELWGVCQSIGDSQSPVAPPACVLSGGEPVVHLPRNSRPRKGGRNQQLVLSATAAAWAKGLEGIALLSGGTDGEDGPTDAAGAIVDQNLLDRARALGLSPHNDLENCNAYPFFDATGGLIKTGPTHTNVMDLRVALIR